MYGDGTQSRCFSEVERGGALPVRPGRLPGGGGPGGQRGLHSGDISIDGPGRLVKELTGSDSPIKLIPYDQAYEEGFEDMPRRVPDVSKLRGLIGFSAPEMGIKQIVQSVITYYRERLTRNL